MRPGTRVVAIPFLMSSRLAPRRRQASPAATAFSWLKWPIS